MDSSDKLYTGPREKIGDFAFDEKTAAVFGDMLYRSVPFYEEVQRMVVEIAKAFAQERSRVYDLGCSLGTTLVGLGQAITDPSVRLVGVDLSKPMLERARQNLEKAGLAARGELEVEDLNHPVKFIDPSVVLMILTLQFVRPLNRDLVIKNIYDSLRTKGCLVLVEKTLGNNSLFNRLFIDLYYAFKKRQGYSELEIAQKREALENVLIPYRIEENIELLNRSGFKSVEVFFKWYNFCGIVAVKD
jgi:tRNA (cmo5U34)-methyltransferase